MESSLQGISNSFGLEQAEALLEVIQQDQLSKGPTAAAFEKALAEKIGIKHALAITLQVEQPYAHHIYHLYTFFYDPRVFGAKKDDFLRYLEQEERTNIATLYFPVHLLAEFRTLGHRNGECPAAEEQYFEHQLQLPIYGHLTGEQIEHMIAAVYRVVEKLGSSN